MSQHANRLRKDPKVAQQLKKHEYTLSSKDPNRAIRYVGILEIGGFKAEADLTKDWLTKMGVIP